MITIIAFIIAIIGYIANGTKKYKIHSYFIWLISNSIWAFMVDDMWLMLMFIIYDVFCMVNIYREYTNVFYIRDLFGNVKKYYHDDRDTFLGI